MLPPSPVKPRSGILSVFQLKRENWQNGAPALLKDADNILTLPVLRFGFLQSLWLWLCSDIQWLAEISGIPTEKSLQKVKSMERN